MVWWTGGLTSQQLGIPFPSGGDLFSIFALVNELELRHFELSDRKMS
jgi:hypothetical protein